MPNLLKEDLFLSPPKLTQQQQVYNFIRDRGRVLTHELVYLSVHYNINDPYTRARELARAGKIWRINPFIMKTIYPYAKEEAWSLYEADK